MPLTGIVTPNNPLTRVAFTNSSADCSVVIQQALFTFTVISASSDTSLGVQATLDMYSHQSFMTTPAVTLAAPAPAGASGSYVLGHSSGNWETIPFVVNPGEDWAGTLRVLWGNGKGATPRCTYSVDFTLSGVYQDGSPWGPTTFTFDNGGLGYEGNILP